MTNTPDLIPDPSTFVADSTYWLQAAQAAVRRECGWHVAPSYTHTVKLNAFGGSRLALPTLHVTDISSFKLEGVEHVQDIAYGSSGLVQLRHGVLLPDMPGSVEVTMTDGYAPEEVPDVIAVMLAASKRGSMASGVVKTQSVNGSTVTYVTGSEPLGIPLFESEKRTLAKYKLPHIVGAKQ
ncbi:hypothetical protein [Bifidobacterium miconisargentati]|uniref:hypothetical protein n=1 Tax=Bifidobacterium miconisargentati TaxID=2834437 RepID=UPI001BDDA431|nr:hypothetical protein [Bifidobacterium miconisargentati]MBW3091328.1 hypothetical protein [Bifidobacterium miconisargentati]